ncbi:MAG: hypothetical protein ABIH46_10790 [Chloroflexota bacterium]
MMKSKDVYEFSFVVEGMSERQAGVLFDLIVAFAEGFEGEVGGGFAPLKEEEPDGKDPVGQEL